jgi:biotin transporter BioY
MSSILEIYVVGFVIATILWSMFIVKKQPKTDSEIFLAGLCVVSNSVFWIISLPLLAVMVFMKWKISK